MSDFDVGGMVSNNSVLGASIAAALAMLYKVWQILKKDRKEDNLDNAERSLRDELRIELKILKEENQKMREENYLLHQELADFKAAISVCRIQQDPKCPLLHMRILGGSNNQEDTNDQ